MDQTFQCPLWLQAPCVGHTLWALNRRHLNYLADYIASGLRRDRSDKLFNSGLGERLPRWMVVAKHRDAVLDSIERMRRK